MTPVVKENHYSIELCEHERVALIAALGEIAPKAISATGDVLIDKHIWLRLIHRLCELPVQQVNK